MADINEEQLLNRLLREVRAADDRIPSPDLEARVLAAWDAEAEVKKGAGIPFPFSRAYYAFGIAAMLALAVALTAIRSAAPPSASTLSTEEAVRPSEPVAPASAAAALPRGTPAFAASQLRRGRPVAPAPAPLALRRGTPITPDAPVAPMEFIPLVPMAESEMTGSFQIVRVQMPRASLGALTSPIYHPHEIVEADVLLGEDGMARGIHLSTNGSPHPRRSR